MREREGNDGKGFHAFPAVNISEFERRNLREMVGKTIEITGIEVKVSERYGEYVVIETMKDGIFFTFSKIVTRQIEKLMGYLREYEGIRASVQLSRNNQVYLSAPGENKR